MNSSPDIEYPIRSKITAPKGKLLFSVDLSQAEAWVVAYLANEPNMKLVLGTGLIHELSARIIFDKPIPDDLTNKILMKNGISKDERYLGKKMNHSCVDPDTEVLTKNGWLKIEHLTSNIEIAQWDKETEEISFVIPEKLHEYDFDGELLNWSGVAFNQLVTPDHKMIFNLNNKYRELPAELMYKYRSGKFPITGKFNREQGIDIDKNIIRLACAIQADGTYLRDKTVFHFSKDRKITRLQGILKALNISYAISSTEDNTTYIRFHTYQPAEVFLTNKKFNYEILKYNYDCLLAFAIETRHWDAHMKGNNLCYSSKYRSNCEVLQTVYHLLGKQCRIAKTGEVWSASQSERRFASIEKLSKNRISYKGKVYCVTTATGFFLIRKNGHISVTGNCNYRTGPFMIVIMINHESDKPPYVTVTLKQTKVYHKRWVNFFNLSVWWKEIEEKLSIDRTLITPYRRKRTFLAQWGDSLFKEATAFIPQSTVADHMYGYIQPELGIKGGLLSVKRDILDKHKEIKLVNSAHDSALFEVPVGIIDEISELVKDKLTRPILINGEQFTIPVDSEVYERWSEKLVV